MYTELVGTWAYAAGTYTSPGGTVTIPAGARVLRIIADSTNQGTGSGTMIIFGGPPMLWTIGYLQLDMLHGLCVSGNNAVVLGSQDIAFISGAGTYLVEYVKAGNT